MSLITVESSELRDLIREAVAEALGRPAAMGKAMVSASESDRLFRKAKGTTAAAFRAGMLKGEQRPGRGRSGITIYVRTADAQRLWGGSSASDLARGTR